METYFETQNAALQCADNMAIAKGYSPQYPEHLWVEHVAYGTNIKRKPSQETSTYLSLPNGFRKI